MTNPLDFFKTLPDPRVKRSQLHDFQEVIAVTLIAVICGCDEWTSIETYGKSKIEFLRTFLKLENGIPSHDTFGNIFAKIDPLKFEECFKSWVASSCKLADGEIVSIDGKRLCGSYDKNDKKAAIHMVSAWANENRLVLGQVKVDEKSNEISAIPILLDLLVLKGCIVTIDAGPATSLHLGPGCQRAIAEKIIEAEANYILALKGNQSSLQQNVEQSFLTEKAAEVLEQLDNDHGRVEKRTYSVITDLKWLEKKEEWKGLKSIVKLQSEVYNKLSGKKTIDIRFYICSLAIVLPSVDIKKIAHGIRSHWGIENLLHWCLDVAFEEDSSRVRKGFADQNFSLIRKVALNLIRKHEGGKHGINNKRMRAGWDDQYLKQILHI